MVRSTGVKGVVNDNLTDGGYSTLLLFEKDITVWSTPIFNPKLFLFTNSATDTITDTLNCRLKYASDLQASFYKFKTHYESLTNIYSKEITFVDIDFNNTLCNGPVDFDSNIWHVRSCFSSY